MNNEAMTMLFTLMSVAALWVGFYWFYRDYRVDRTRQLLFAVRDDLFDLGVSEELPFSHPAYGLLRSITNGFIRFGHRLRFFSVMWTLFVLRRDRVLLDNLSGFQERWRTATESLRPEVRARCETILLRVNTIVLEQLVLTSLFLVVLIVPLVCVIVGRVLWKSIAKHANRTRRWFNDLDSAALSLGEV